MNNKEEKYDFWKEYPERDHEHVSYYPPTIGPLEPGDVWQKKSMGLYLHIPFCKSSCKYCPFNKYPLPPELIENYLRALIKEIKMTGALPYMRDGNIVAVNFGGGTPTALSAEQLIDLLNCCRDNFDIRPGAEVTIEANPNSVDEDKLKSLLNWGVNRVNFGIQSFNDYNLELMGRGHRSRQSIASLKMSRHSGIENLGIDLLYRIPGQTLPDWETELDMGIALGIDHISIAPLLLNPGTPLFKEHMAGRIPPQPDEVLETELYERARQKLTTAGYRHYIISDFVLPGKECDYHRISWQVPQREYLGLGAGSNSYVHGSIYTNMNSLEEYIRTIEQGRLPISFGRRLTKEDEISRAMVLGIKFLKIDKKEFKKQFGLEMECLYRDTIRRLEGWGLITDTPDDIRLTPKGMSYISNVNKAFYTREHYRVPQPTDFQLHAKA